MAKGKCQQMISKKTQVGRDNNVELFVKEADGTAYTYHEKREPYTELSKYWHERLGYVPEPIT